MKTMFVARPRLWATISLLLLTVPVSAAAKIVPGQSIGPWRLGAIAPEVRGSTTASRALNPHWIDWVARSRSGKVAWPDAFVVPDAKIKKLKLAVIRIANADFKTSSGISVASSFSQIQRVFPGLKLVVTYDNPHFGTVGVYDSLAKGIFFEVLLDRKTHKPVRCLVTGVHYRKRSVVPALKLYRELGRTLRAKK